MAYKQCITNQSTLRVTAAYGQYPSGGYHGGLDTVHTNNLAYAPKSGTVVVAHTWQGGTTGVDSWGNYIVVSMGNNQYWLAGHFASQIHSVGEVLTEGDYIGQQGRTGNVTGIHTHWEFWNGGQSTAYRADPSSILRIPNTVGTYEVEWDTESGSPDPPTPPDPPQPAGDYIIIPSPEAGTYKYPVRVSIRVIDSKTLETATGTIEYFVSPVRKTPAYKSYTGKILLNHKKNYLYIKFTDEAGNYVTYEGFYIITSKNFPIYYWCKIREME